MKNKTYITQQNDMVDKICYTHYGQCQIYTEKLLELNPFLRNYGCHLPIGLTLILPHKISNNKKRTQLWD